MERVFNACIPCTNTLCKVMMQYYHMFLLLESLQRKHYSLQRNDGSHSDYDFLLVGLQLEIGFA